MSTEHVVDGEAVEVGQAVEVMSAPTLDLAPKQTAQDLVARLDVIRDAMNNAMQEGVDYGRIPGTDKPTLLKPGAEKLGVLFQLDVQIVNEQKWGPGDHLTVTSRATVYHAPTGHRLGYGEGVCSTREKKYGKRKAGRACPQCGKEAIIKGKAEYGGGWVCFGKKGGCGAKFSDDDASITGQQVGEVENPDLPDMWNTVTKMGEKRARVDAVLAVTGASALFTQDAEDMAPEPPRPPSPPPSPSPAPAAKRAPKKQAPAQDAQERPVSQEQGEAILARVKELGASVAPALHAWCDENKVPTGDKFTDRLSGMTATQGLALQKWLAEAKA